MARPKNIEVLSGNTLVSLPPAKLKEYLRGLKDGTITEGSAVTGTLVGTARLDLGTVTAQTAETVYRDLFNESMDQPAPVEAGPAPVEAGPAPIVID